MAKIGVVLGLVATLTGCHGDDGGSTDASGGGDGPKPGSISGVAHVLHGASATFAFQALTPVPAVPANGMWWVSPNKVRVKIDQIGFNGANGTGTGTVLMNCMVEYDRSTPALTNLLDCPFTLDLPVTTLDIGLQLNATFEILISDPVNGIFTDASVAGGLTTSPPAVGPPSSRSPRPTVSGPPADRSRRRS
ncbi:MAG: hypothetical protein IPQ07_10845 [Myxococcales bacterium]|nr:hypothetical protein [Myxococcales bacterium]